jgi:hypothetical protein
MIKKKHKSSLSCLDKMRGLNICGESNKLIKDLPSNIKKFIYCVLEVLLYDYCVLCLCVACLCICVACLVHGC